MKRYLSALDFTSINAVARLPRILLVLACLLFVGELAAAEKKIATKLDDLPRHTYAVDATATELITDAGEFEPFAQRVRSDIEAVLDEYQIEDKTTLKRFKGALLSLELLAGNDDAATALIRELRELEDKPAQKLLTGLSTEARLETEAQLGSEDLGSTEFQNAFQQRYLQKLQALPWELVQAELKQLKGSMEIRSRNLYIGMVESQIQPALEETGTVSSDVAESLVGIRAFLETTLPLKDAIVAALDTVVSAHKVTKPDIWADRSVTLDPSVTATPVVVAVWDSGVDTVLFLDRLHTNPDEEFNYLDDDGNGFVDDLHGIAFDVESGKTPQVLFPLGDAQPRFREMKSQIKGMLDLRSAIESEEATALKQRLSGIEPDQVKPFVEDLNLFSNFAHGTHVAGIAAQGNPFIRILPARLTFDHHMIPLEPTVERARAEAAMYAEAVRYFRETNVRVVNMSWGGSQKDVEAALEANGVESDATKRAELAREIFRISRDALEAAIASAPEILFVCAAGNSDNDVEFDEFIPSSFRLPNMITVGAVDQAGDRTSFTSFGDNVEVYANGFEVNSFVPGGDRMMFSGTSMASPNVANLAAKLIALSPSLTVSEVIDLIKSNTEPVEGGDIALIHPANTVHALRTMQ